MGNRAWFWIAMAVVGLAAIAGVSTYSYNLGLAQGLADNGRAIAFAPRPWGSGSGSSRSSRLFILFWIFVARGLFWRGAWRGRGCRY